MADLTLTDESTTLKWRVFAGYEDIKPGTARREGDLLVWSTSPGEWTVYGDRPDGETVDLTHVRAAYRLSGDPACTVINRVCGLDLTADMFPSGAAARTLFAGVATEVVRDDLDDAPSYLIVPSSSFGRYIHEVITDAAAGFGLG